MSFQYPLLAPMTNSSVATNSTQPFLGQPWLVEERDACGVGFIANLRGEPDHTLVEQALKALGCMEHRGGCSADNDSGDGAGVMTAIPRELLAQWFATRNLPMPDGDRLGVGMVFLPQEPTAREVARAYVEEVVRLEKLTVLGWREVPVNPDVLGSQARSNQPHIEQILVTCPAGCAGDELDRRLYIARSIIGKRLAEDFYVCSFSSRTIVYKGMVRSVILGEFYLDLLNPQYISNFAVYHRRFSTNTMPKWPLAQPMRMLGHNGEINTLLGNINWMAAREAALEVPGWTKAELEALTPIVNQANSDSYNLDSALELLTRTGRGPLEAVMILVPEAYKNQPALNNYPEISDFYDYYSGLQEPWDGPALLVFSDGKIVGAGLDRNGLRPARYCITKDDYIVVGSEAGVVDLPEASIVEKGRLAPGQMIAVDLDQKKILKNYEIKQQAARKHPYGEWLKTNRQMVASESFADKSLFADAETTLQQQAAFGYTAEDVEMVIVPMANQGKEPTFCMGDDAPLAVLSHKPRLLYDYFKQRFAQVTNPPIDPLRENLVMSLAMFLGPRGNILEPKAEAARMIKLRSPLVNELELEAIKQGQLNTAVLSTLYDLGGVNSLQNALDNLVQQAIASVQSGIEILILTDRPNGATLSENQSFIPPLLAVGAVHHHLIRAGLRLQASLVVDTAQCWSTHHFACLVGYGASAICPYLALESVRQWWRDEKTQKLMDNGRLAKIDLATALQNYRQSVEAGLFKILSKMGISLLSSYHGAQIFEAIGLGAELVEYAFAGTTSRVGGLTMADVAQEVMVFHGMAFPAMAKKLENFGFVNYRPGGEYHMNSPEMSKSLHKAVAAYQRGSNGANAEAYDHYGLYRQYLRGRPVTALRDLLDLNPDQTAIPLEEVESVESIVKRFCTGGMSLGALSREAHETLAIAMNRLGAKSNSGEGGEDTVRYLTLDDVDAEGNSPTLPHLHGLENGDTANSAIKQIASGRFGVTPEYLMSGKQLEIKMAQGAKPGEGGQLPGKKVSEYIAMLRRSKPGVTLISPPPHHDIYSIEDLAQLIYDLHQINPQAQVSVKLVAEIGIGTIAAGVAKANADIIQISGHDGGTGASPLSSIKHAGSPWELGVTEVHRVLMENQLRDRVLLRADGGLKTGWDVVMAALMGAEEYGFGSIAMIAEGCIMARVCHTNNCPVGVATQQERLRQRFKGVPGQVVNFFYFIAEEVRSLLAHLGYRSLDDIIGRTDLLKVRSDVQLSKTQNLTLDCLLNLPDTKQNRQWLNHEPVHSNGPVLDDDILADPDIQEAINHQTTVTKTYRLVNTDRTVGTRLSGAIAKRYGNNGFTGSITLNFQGAAGQSFGAFNLDGMTLHLQGEANDYVGKGMNGGEIVIVPHSQASFAPEDNVIIGNTCLYGATGGNLYANGRAGERFAVRNSMGKAVIEGAGDHCCEYMTGGVIVVLGPVGRNVGAGMTGGLAYFLDEVGDLPEKINPEIITLQRIAAPKGEEQLKAMITAHVERTGSPKGKKILANWSDYLGQFWQAVPPSEADSPEANGDASLAGEKTLTSV
ncbi:glutamate synthase large subunit [Synechocystis salina]|uniref:Glutamate synthase large subunit n=1 Tax=Synechocystis salina LEGE 00031 TaxID=1828736 RepID=A0ABR9VVD2_9SYNC|nr:glutamate synthase large subunit [Synechocystis salina LEGE 00041]MBE9255309.1 glutamate synthase large subunit [Synechocystis salina LEGE 00031]